MLTTPNFGFKKIEGTDSPPDITVGEGNWDIVDAELKEAEAARAVQVNKDGSVPMDDITIGARKANTTVGTNSFAQGGEVEASGNYTHGEGYRTKASGEASHAEGNLTQATNFQCHAEGYMTTASGDSAHAEGANNTASGNHAHAEGCDNIASGAEAHAEGTTSRATGSQSHSGGLGTKASGSQQTAIGRYNVEDTSSLLLVGNGTSDSARSNALKLSANGDLDVAGSLVGMVTTLAAFGEIGTSDASGGIITIYGKISTKKYKNKILEVEIEASITAINVVSSSLFTFGFSIPKIASLLGVTLASDWYSYINNSMMNSLELYNSSGAMITTDRGFGWYACVNTSGSRLEFGRIYNNAGAVGSYPNGQTSCYTVGNIVKAKTYLKLA